MIYSQSVEKAVRWFANWVVLNTPTIQYDDAVQDLWVEVLKATPRFDDATKNAFTTFIGQHLRWRAINMQKAEFRRMEYDTAYASEEPQVYEPQEEKSEEELLDSLRKKLKPFDQEILDLLLNPPPVLVSDLTSSRRIAAWQMASYLKVPKQTIDYSVRQIRRAIKKLATEEK